MSRPGLPASDVAETEHDIGVAWSKRDIVIRLLWVARNHGFGTRVATRIEKGKNCCELRDDTQFTTEAASSG